MLHSNQLQKDIKNILKSAIKKMLWNIENIVMMLIKHLEMNQIFSLNKPTRSWYAIK